MDKQSEKKAKLSMENKIRLAIGCMGSFYMASAGVFQSNCLHWAVTMLIAYILTVPIIFIITKNSTLCKTSKSPKENVQTILAYILYIILAVEWLFNCLDYYWGSEQIWKFSLCLCLLLNGIYAQFIGVLRKEMISIITSSLSWLMSIAGMTFDGVTTVQLLWMSSLGFILSLVIPTLIEIGKRSKNQAKSDI
ncbi:MAG: hypothetical protein J6Y99_08470 [Bacteroidales bacterium]|nr:hypothetical protein [Bacteroidales bacterium]